MNHLTGSPCHKLDRDAAQSIVNQAEITEEWVEDEITEEVVEVPPCFQVSKRPRIPTTPPSACESSVVTLNNCVTELTAAVTRMQPPCPSTVPTFGTQVQMQYRSQIMPPPSGSPASSSAGPSSHVPFTDLNLVLESITRAEAAARQAANIAQNAASCFNAEAAVLQQAKDTLRINVLR